MTDDIYVECECGARIRGISENHALSLMDVHLSSKRHKELMEIKARREENSKELLK